MAAWLNSRGIAAFMLKYRLIPTSDNFAAEVEERLNNRDKMAGPMRSLAPLILADGQQAVRWCASGRPSGASAQIASASWASPQAVV